MNLFQFVTAEYTCPKCGWRRSVISPTFGRIYWILCVLAALPLWIVLLGKPWNLPWYYAPSFIAGEMLLAFTSGFLVSWPLFLFDSWGTIRCRSCRAMMMFNGRHFDPKGHPRPHWKDIVLIAAFLAANVALWLIIATH
ncbi:MAG: hypothetical protein GX455_16985 [Phycisphaerae bacterium]|nr:hypothetical protein [Phycisphaerae bacterium]